MGLRVKADRVTLYAMIPSRLCHAGLCARIGAIHFNRVCRVLSDAWQMKVRTAKSSSTADFGARGGKATPLKANADKPASCNAASNVWWCVRTGGDVAWTDTRDVDILTATGQRGVRQLRARSGMTQKTLFHPLTPSGSSRPGPRGLCIPRGRFYLVYCCTNPRGTSWIYHDGDVLLVVTADVVWVTGIAILSRAHLPTGADHIWMFEGVPPTPTQSSADLAKRHEGQSLHRADRHSCVDGQRRAFVDGCDPEAPDVVGHRRVNRSTPKPETGTMMWLAKGNCSHRRLRGGRPKTVKPRGHMQPKPGAAELKPFFVFKPVVLEPYTGCRDYGMMSRVFLCIARQLARQMRHQFGAIHERFEQTYFSDYRRLLLHGDGCPRGRGRRDIGSRARATQRDARG